MDGAFCPQCGAAANAPNNASPNPYTQGSQGYPGNGGYVDVSDYLALNIFATICCCLPFGIVGIIYAVKCRSAKEVGDVNQAIEAGGKAKMWFWIAFALGLIANVAYGFIRVAAEQGSINL